MTCRNDGQTEKKLFLKWLSTKKEEAIKHLKTLKELRRLITEKKNKMWKKKCQKINTYIGGRKCSETWNVIGFLRIKDKIKPPSKQQKQWKDHYMNLLTDTRL